MRTAELLAHCSQLPPSPPVLAGGIVVEKAASRRGWLQVAATAAATWAALGVRRLANEGGIMADRLRQR